MPDTLVESVARKMAETHSTSALLSYNVGASVGFWDNIAQAAISEMFERMSEPSEAVVEAGGLAINPDRDVLVVTGKEATDAFTAMLAVLKSEAGR